MSGEKSGLTEATNAHILSADTSVGPRIESRLSERESVLAVFAALGWRRPDAKTGATLKVSVAARVNAVKMPRM